MFLKWGAPTSAGCRQKRWITYDHFFNIKAPKLSTKITRRVGRSLNGQKSVLSKGKAYSRFLYKKSQSLFSNSYVLGVVVNIEPRGLNRSCSALVKTAIGAWYYMTPTQHFNLLSYMGVNNPAMLKKTITQVNWYWQLNAAHPHAKICCLHLVGYNQPIYALAPGSSCILIAPELWEGWSFILLPSKQAKLVDSFSWALQGAPSPVFNHNTNCAKAVKYKLIGAKSLVRGVAKNPNDHPHGGRTKTIKYPRTPWGRTAKKSRQPSLQIKLRPLAKRNIKAKSQHVLNQKMSLTDQQILAQPTEQD